MNRKEIEEKFREFFVGTLELDASLLSPESRLKDDIGLTSLDIVDTKLFIEKTFDWVMTREDVLSLNTLSDLYSSVESHIV